MKPTGRPSVQAEAFVSVMREKAGASNVCVVVAMRRRSASNAALARPSGVRQALPAKPGQQAQREAEVEVQRRPLRPLLAGRGTSTAEAQLERGRCRQLAPAGGTW